MRQYSEKVFQKDFVKKLNDTGWNCVHYPGDGIPDLVCVKGGQGFFCELKVLDVKDTKQALKTKFTHAQIPTYLDWCSRGLLSSLFIGFAVKDENKIGNEISYRLAKIDTFESIVKLKDSKVFQIIDWLPEIKTLDDLLYEIEQRNKERAGGVYEGGW